MMNINYYMRTDSFDLFKPNKGYDLGNMFSNLYDGYKNYQPINLVGRSEQEKAWLELSRIGFAMHEMNLFLDVHPDNMKIQNLFNDYRKMFNNLEKSYEEKYGPLNTCSNTLDNNPTSWVNNSWPWEERYNV